MYFHPIPYSESYPVEQLGLLKKPPVVIGEGCFLGANSIILKGTTLVSSHFRPYFMIR